MEVCKRQDEMLPLQLPALLMIIQRVLYRVLQERHTFLHYPYLNPSELLMVF